MNEIRKPDGALMKILRPQELKAGVRYVPSRFAFSFGHNGKEYVFNTLTRQCLETVLPCNCLAGEGYDSLIEQYFLVPEGKDECAFYENIISLMRLYSRRPGVTTYTILPTLGCNARCVYCYEEGMKQVTMTPEIVDRSIEYIMETRRKDAKVYLNWFGGEPLLCPAIIDRVCDGLAAEEIPYHSGMISNASLITDEIIEKMTGKWKLRDIQISMDGDESAYIARKRYYQYHDYYCKALSAADRLAERGVVVTIRCNVDNDNWDSVQTMLRDMQELIKNRDRVCIYFVPLNQVRMSGEGLPLWKKIIAARPAIEAAGFRTLSSLDLRPVLRVTFCMADAGNVVIGPDGSLYPCEHCSDEKRIGDIFTGITEKDRYADFCRMDQTREMCRGCTFLPDCTSFRNCEVRDLECSKVMEAVALASLKRIVDQQDAADEEPEQPVC